MVLPIAKALHLLYLEANDAEKARALRRNKTDHAAQPAAITMVARQWISAYP